MKRSNKKRIWPIPPPPPIPLLRMDPTYPPWEKKNWLNRFVAKVIAPRLIEWIAVDESSRERLKAALEDRL